MSGKPETTAQLVSQILDCLEQLAERFSPDILQGIAVREARWWVEALIEEAV